jgi:hypothetical protein
MVGALGYGGRLLGYRGVNKSFVICLGFCAGLIFSVLPSCF